MPQTERVVVLLRHGLAEDLQEGTPDEERALTSEGHAEMMQLAQGLENLFPKAEAIYSSPLVRAMQTAQWVAKAYRLRLKIAASDALRPAASAHDFRAFLDGVAERRVIMVGHEPNLTAGFLALTGLADAGQALGLKKGGCYAVRISGGRGTVEWVLTPKVLRRVE